MGSVYVAPRTVEPESWNHNHRTSGPPPLGQSCSTVQRPLDLVLEAVASQGPAAVGRIANFIERVLIHFLAEELAIGALTLLPRAAEALILLVCREQRVGRSEAMMPIA